METKRGFNWALLKEICVRPGVLTVSILYFLLQLAFNLIAWTIAPQNQAKYQLIQLITWRTWIAVTPILTLLLIVLIVRASIQAVGQRETKANERIAATEKEREALKSQLEAAVEVGTLKSLSADALPKLLALGQEWGTLHDTCLRGAGDGMENKIDKLTRRTEEFLRGQLDDVHAAMFKNEPPEHREIEGRGARDKHLIGLTAAKLKKVNQIIEEQRRGQ